MDMSALKMVALSAMVIPGKRRGGRRQAYADTNYVRYLTVILALYSRMATNIRLFTESKGKLRQEQRLIKETYFLIFIRARWNIWKIPAVTAAASSTAAKWTRKSFVGEAS